MTPSLQARAASASMRNAKDELRRAMRERRLSLSADQARTSAARAAAHLATLPEWAAARTVALYAPVRGELDTAPLARELRARGATVCYPCMAPGHRLLAFHAVDDEALLSPNRLGIPEPGDAAPLVAAEALDLIVVPGLAFDTAGGRLGWGRAYYDTTLAAAPRATRVGYAYSFQLVPAVPVTAEDARVDYVCTEAGVRATGARPPAPGPGRKR